MNPLDYYVKEAPTDQNVLDIFQGHWSSAMPQHTGLVSQPGPAALFEDDRLTWAEQQFGGFSGQRILELGPLEGAHSYICQQKGAAEVVAVEANSQSFLRCLCIKEIFKLDRVTFKLGDLNMYLRSGAPHYDIVLACGVLYHMVDPLLTLRLIAEVSDRLFLWTHYYDADIIGADRAQAATFEQSETRSFRGHEFKLAKKRYESALNAVDAVLCFAVLEHVKYPWLVAQEMCRVLKPGGRLAVNAPFLAPLHGYPGHYYNMSASGLLAFFEDSIAVQKHFVPPSMGPIWALHWMVYLWSLGLTGNAKEEFLKLTVAELAQAPTLLLARSFVTELAEEKNFEIACGTYLVGQKKMTGHG